jgi:hypothetical protein
VWFAPWLGPNGETVLVALTRNGRVLEQRIVGPEDSSDDAVEELWDALENADPSRPRGRRPTARAPK